VALFHKSLTYSQCNNEIRTHDIRYHHNWSQRIHGLLRDLPLVEKSMPTIFMSCDNYMAISNRIVLKVTQRACLVWLWFLLPKSQKSNQRARTRKQLFAKVDFIVVQNWKHLWICFYWLSNLNAQIWGCLNGLDLIVSG
jgi:hypothetical protein